MTTEAYELPAPALMQPESEHDGDGGPLVSYYTADQVRAAIIAERERCALIVDYVETPTFRHGGREYDNTTLLRQQIAAAIRAG
jgi:23S rRNA G2445 N2-methylase RlmL